MASVSTSMISYVLRLKVKVSVKADTTGIGLDSIKWNPRVAVKSLGVLWAKTPWTLL